MNRQERLREQYEDTLFAVMMDELASAQGNAALEENERLKNDPNAAVPEHIDRRCMQTIRNHFRKDTAQRTGRATVKAMGRAAMVFGLASALFIGAFAASESFRLNTMNLIVETLGVSTDFYFAPPAQKEVPQIKAGWIPEGFLLEDEGIDNMQSWFEYGSKSGQDIYCVYVFGDNQIMSVDTEGAEVTLIQINGMKATMACKEEGIQIAWALNDGTGFMYLFGSGVQQEDLIRVAENLQY